MKLKSPFYIQILIGSKSNQGMGRKMEVRKDKLTKYALKEDKTLTTIIELYACIIIVLVVTQYISSQNKPQILKGQTVIPSNQFFQVMHLISRKKNDTIELSEEKQDSSCYQINKHMKNLKYKIHYLKDKVELVMLQQFLKPPRIKF